MTSPLLTSLLVSLAAALVAALPSALAVRFTSNHVSPRPTGFGVAYRIAAVTITTTLVLSLPVLSVLDHSDLGLDLDPYYPGLIAVGALLAWGAQACLLRLQFRPRGVLSWRDAALLSLALLPLSSLVVFVLLVALVLTALTGLLP